MLHIHANLMVADYNEPAIQEKADDALDKLFKWILANDGAITGEHGVGLAKGKWFREAVGEASFAAHLAIKQALDSKNLLNPEKFLG